LAPDTSASKETVIVRHGNQGSLNEQPEMIPLRFQRVPVVSIVGDEIMCVHDATDRRIEVTPDNNRRLRMTVAVAEPANRSRHKGLNNRAENSHLPTRKRERVLQRFKSAQHAQRFLVPFSAVSNHFRPRRHRLSAATYRQFRTQAHTAWHDVTQAGVRH
jgi:hypothetical protein